MQGIADTRQLVHLSKETTAWLAMLRPFVEGREGKNADLCLPLQLLAVNDYLLQGNTRCFSKQVKKPILCRSATLFLI